MSLKIISSFSNRLNEVLNNMTLTELAFKIGMSKQSLSAYSLGVRNPKPPTIKAIAELLNVNPAWLMGYDVEKQMIVNQPSAQPIECVELNELCKQMNNLGMKMITEYAKYILSNDEYKKDDSNISRKKVAG